MQTILFFGDSLTAGYGLRNAVAESFPALIEQKIAAAGYDYKVINAGLSGDTSGGGLARIDYWLAQPLSAFVLELGINDVIRGISPQTTLNNLQAITAKVKAKYPGVKIAIMGMQIPLYIRSGFANQFNGIYRTLADSTGAVLVPFFLDGVAGKAALNLPDHLHPNAAGYQIIAGKTWPFIEKLLVKDVEN